MTIMKLKSFDASRVFARWVQSTRCTKYVRALLPCMEGGPCQSSERMKKLLNLVVILVGTYVEKCLLVLAAIQL